MLLRRRLRLALTGILWPISERRRAVLETDGKLAVLLGDEVVGRQDEDAVLALGGLNVTMFTLGSVHQAEMHEHRFLVVVRPQAEGIVAQVLAGLDVVLVAVGPVELDLLALIGNGIDARLIDALGEEVALRVISAEEAEQMVVDLVPHCTY